MKIHIKRVGTKATLYKTDAKSITKGAIAYEKKDGVLHYLTTSEFKWTSPAENIYVGIPHIQSDKYIVIKLEKGESLWINQE